MWVVCGFKGQRSIPGYIWTTNEIWQEILHSSLFKYIYTFLFGLEHLARPSVHSGCGHLHDHLPLRLFSDGQTTQKNPKIPHVLVKSYHICPHVLTHICSMQIAVSSQQICTNRHALTPKNKKINAAQILKILIALCSLPIVHTHTHTEKWRWNVAGVLPQ